MTHPQHSLRPAIWAVIRRLAGEGRSFDARDIRGELRGVTQLARIRDYLQALAAGGYLMPISRPGWDGYRLRKDNGVEAPRLRPDGTPVLLGAGREQMWRAMRILGEWSITELCATATSERWAVAETEARDYCQRLTRAGYLLRDGSGTGARYRLLPTRARGPQPPQIQRGSKNVFDPNTGQLYAPDGAPLARQGSAPGLPQNRGKKLTRGINTPPEGAAHD
jgi:hypothetical protein